MLPRWVTATWRPLAVTVNAVMFLYGLGMVAGMAMIAFTGEELGFRLFAAALALGLGWALGGIALGWWRGAASRRTSGGQAALGDLV